jgi:DNA end-binding protein Ku
MQAAAMVGIGRFVLRTKPHLVAIRPLKEALALETLFFGDEVRSPDAITSGLAGITVADRELKTAQQLIRAMATEWSPSRHADVYREELLELLRKKPAAAAAPVVDTATDTGLDDLMQALRASVEAAKRRRGATSARGSKQAG